MLRPARQARPESGSPATAADPPGFTLVEVMVALAILALALTVVADAQQAGMRRTLRAQFVTTATMLAREKMIEVEERLYEQGFSQFEEEQAGAFEAEGMERFRYHVKIDKVELPSGLDAQALAGALGGGREGAEGSAGGAGGATAIGGQLLGSQLELFRTVLEQSIRRVSLQVLWREGRSEQHVQLDAYFTDPSLVGGGLTGGLAAPPTAQQGGSGVSR